MLTHFAWMTCAAFAVALTVSACGGSDSPPASPSPTPTPTPTPTPGETTVTITASGVSPRAVTISPGSRVTFVNNDNRPHDMASNPHPEHTQCTEINSVGFIQPGQRGTTSNMNTARSCGYHDHNLSTDTSLQGTITVQ